MRPGFWTAAAGALICAGVAMAAADALAAEDGIPGARRAELLKIVRQDCGSCHGMRLTGGLGPALTPQALDGMPADSLAATIYHGRPGTPMPGWKPMLSPAEADWIARRLLAGLAPDEGMSK